MNFILEPLNLILLIIAAVILWRLKSVLGERTGLEKRPIETPEPASRSSAPESPATTSKEETPSMDSIWRGYAEEGSSTARGLVAIAEKSRNFTPQEFLGGAKLAYEMVLEAFAKGDKAALKPLLSKEVYDGFAQAVADREAAQNRMIMQFVGVKSARIEDARLEGKLAQIAVRFVGEMISATLDKNGRTLEGDPNQVREVSDLWTFERDVTGRDPNWKLVDTSDTA